MSIYVYNSTLYIWMSHTPTHCNFLQHMRAYTATRCNALQHMWAYNSAPWHTWMIHTATHCNILQHIWAYIATHCNTLQHTTTHMSLHSNTVIKTATHCVTLQHFWSYNSAPRLVFVVPSGCCDRVSDLYLYATYKFTWLTWLIHMWHDLFVCVTWLIYKTDVTHAYWRWKSYELHDAFTWVTWLICAVPSRCCLHVADLHNTFI